MEPTNGEQQKPPQREKPRKKTGKKKLRPGRVDGRPRLPFNWDQFNALCQIQCTQAEVAFVMGVSMDVVERRCREELNCTFAEAREQKSASGKMSLRRAQFESALGRKAEFDKDGRLLRSELRPSTTMQIFLGKNYLDQKNVWDIGGAVEVNHTGDAGDPYKQLAELFLTHGTGLAKILAEQGIDLNGTKVEAAVARRGNGSNGRGNGKAGAPAA